MYIYICIVVLFEKNMFKQWLINKIMRDGGRS